MKFWKTDKFISISPVLCMVIMESSTLGHIYRMIKERSSLGQNILSHIFVIVALWLWLNWYSITTPNERLAINATRVGVLTNMAALLVNIYFRYFYA